MSLFSTLSVSASGMAAQRQRAEVLVENLANADTTRTAEGGPYRRKDVVFETSSASSPFSSLFQSALDGEASGVSVSQVVTDSRPPELRYMPGHPDADKDGYVAYPRVNPAEDMVDLLGASRGYEANVAAMGAVKDMIQRSIDLLR
ncbi:MAG: flagellar basal body rod protein FlgC [Bryobacteraceae bacterium]|jgi:flagellar basal-body rod protein FlgC